MPVLSFHWEPLGPTKRSAVRLEQSSMGIIYKQVVRASWPAT